jgi:hypothetical protein
MPDPPKRRPRIPKPGVQAQHRAGRPVNETELRKLFVAARIEQKEAQGILTTKHTYDRHLAIPPGNEPYCTRSQCKGYFDHHGRKVAEVHYYLRPNGTIAASGLLDPKEVVFEGILHFLDRR